MSQQDKAFINLAGEFLVAGELNRRRITASITYGASKSADIFAFSHDSKLLSRIEVKATDKKRWPVGHRALSAETKAEGIFWVLVLLPQDNASPRYFVFTGIELNELTNRLHSAYMAGFAKKHGRDYEGVSIPALNLKDVLAYENKWDSVVSYLTWAV